MTIVRFTQHSGYTYYYTDWDNNMSGEYVPLTEYQELKTHMESLAKESYELKGLIQRILNFSPPLIDDCFDSDVESYQKLKQLFNDCREAL